MHIASLYIEGYRCFEEQTVEFRPGLNVIIGENNAGKTALFDAMKLVFERGGRKRPSAYDFHRASIGEDDPPPEIHISATLRSDDNDTDDDLGVVATWLTKMDESAWEATLTYSFVLPEKNHEEFYSRVQDAPGDSDEDRYWYGVKSILGKYVSRIYGGEPSRQNRAEPDMLAKFDLQFLDAIRDAEKNLRSGSDPLLRRMLESVLDSSEELKGSRSQNEKEFYESTQELIGNLKERVDKRTLFRLLKETGAGEDEMGELDLEGRLTEADVLSALRLILRKDGFEIPVSHNGLGYNNLIYISLVLRDLALRASERDNENAPVFPLLLIEEPEAHLHPSLQHRLLVHLRERLGETGGEESSRQVLLTTHSTHVTSAAGLDSIICLYISNSGGVDTAYPGRVYDTDDPEEQDSKAYVERYLDATKSAMLFSKSTIFVEGSAEMQLLPCFAEYVIDLEEGETSPFDRNYVSIISVDGLCFKHFMPLFGAVTDATRASYSLPRKAACLIDADPKRKSKSGDSSSRAKSCWPYEINQDEEAFEYKPISEACEKLQNQVSTADNIRVFHGRKTLEYDLAKANGKNPLLITPSCTHDEKLSKYVNEDEEHEALKTKASEAIQSLESWSPTENGSGESKAVQKENARFATHYLLSVEDSKGNHAFQLEAALRENLREGDSEEFELPSYVREAVQWVCSFANNANESQGE